MNFCIFSEFFSGIFVGRSYTLLQGIPQGFFQFFEFFLKRALLQVLQSYRVSHRDFSNFFEFFLKRALLQVLQSYKGGGRAVFLYFFSFLEKEKKRNIHTDGAGGFKTLDKKQDLVYLVY
jgi:hypothetical protein